jgi:cytochrome c oxidase subunit 2
MTPGAVPTIGGGSRHRGVPKTSRVATRRLIVVGTAVLQALMAVVTAPAASAQGRVWFPPPISSYGAQIDRLFWIIVWITGIIFLLVEGALVWFVLQYRQRPGRKASYVHGSTLVEVIWTVVPALIVIWLAFASQQVWSYVQGPPPPHQVEVMITAEQFAWNIRYAGPDGRLETDDDIETINQMHLPVDQVALVHMRSKDVIHSFFVPEFRMKRDAVPGLTTRLWLQPTTTGQFEITCAELCGLGHYRMRGYLTVEEPEAFEAWLAETQAQE